MKRFLLPLMALLVITSCKKEEAVVEEDPQLYICTTCPKNSEADPAQDQKSGGVYKGVLAGSSGTIALYINNNGNEKRGELVFNNQRVQLTTASLSEWSSGQAIDTAKFTGVWNGEEVDVTFSASDSGRNGVAKVVIPGHSIMTTIYKEKSLNVVKGFEGNYTGDAEGAFNMALDGNDFTILFPGIGGAIQGRQYDNKLDIVSKDGNIIIEGNFYDDEVGGTWKNLETGQSGGWKALRTL